MHKYKFPVVNIAQFYPRPGTVAAKMTKLKSCERQSLLRMLTWRVSMSLLACVSHDDAVDVAGKT